MITWINLLHLYQPANVDGHIIKEATEMSYMRLARALEDHPEIKFTFNITGCLFLRWEELGYTGLIKRIKALIKKGQLELTGSAAYHPIMPLVPEQEVIKQIKENEKILKKHFGKNFKPKGFFLPELAYSPAVAKIVKKMGYQWLLLDEIAYSGKLDKVDYNKIYKDKNSDLKVVIRSRKYSNSYVPQIIAKTINAKGRAEKEASAEKIIITATDGELYGLRHNDQTAVFEKLLNNSCLKTSTMSEFIENYKSTTSINPLPHSWATSEKELQKGQYFNLWQNKTNVIQKKLWQLAYLAHDTVEKYKKDDNYYWARWHLVRGLASCTFWWASAKDFRLFGPISWSPDEIERGANELIRSIRTLDDVTTRVIKIKGEKLYISIKRAVWKKHWTYYWKK